MPPRRGAAAPAAPPSDLGAGAPSDLGAGAPSSLLDLVTARRWAAARALAASLPPLSAALLATSALPGREGENALHVALELRAPPALCAALARAAPRLLLGRLRGAFFARDPPLGDYPLALAAALGRADAVEALLGAGADALAQDARGRTALHVAVLHARLGAARALARAAPLLWAVVDAAGYDPLVTAARLDSAAGTATFLALLDARRSLKWRFANAACWGYELDGLDDVAGDAARGGAAAGAARASVALREYPHDAASPAAPPAPRPPPPKQWPRASLLEMIAREGVHRAEGVCATPFVARLVDAKWKMYAARGVRSALAATVVFLAAITAVAALHAAPREPGAPSRLPRALAAAGFGAAAACDAGAGAGAGAGACALLVGAEAAVLAGAALRASLHARQFLTWRARNERPADGASYAHFFRDAQGAATSTR